MGNLCCLEPEGKLRDTATKKVFIPPFEGLNEEGPT